jgi:hypothetical protein
MQLRSITHQQVPQPRQCLPAGKNEVQRGLRHGPLAAAACTCLQQIPAAASALPAGRCSAAHVVVLLAAAPHRQGQLYELPGSYTRPAPRCCSQLRLHRTCWDQQRPPALQQARRRPASRGHCWPRLAGTLLQQASPGCCSSVAGSSTQLAALLRRHRLACQVQLRLQALLQRPHQRGALLHDARPTPLYRLPQCSEQAGSALPAVPGPWPHCPLSRTPSR